METFDYLEDVFGKDNISIIKINMGNLPPYLLELYTIYKCKILEKDYTLLMPIGEQKIIITSILKQFKALQKIGLDHPILVLQQVSTLQRQSYISQGISFIVPYNQMFIPDVYVNIDERKKLTFTTKIEKFSPTTQLLFIALLYQNEKNINQTILAQKLNVSLMTINRGIRELYTIGLLERTGKNTRKIYFRNERSIFWEKGKEYLISPIREQGFFTEIPLEIDKYYSSITALSRLTMINASLNEHFATSKESKKLLRKDELNHDFFGSNEGQKIVEIWSYNPAIFADELRNIDIFSLYAIFKDNDDERISIEINKRLEEFFNARIE